MLVLGVQGFRMVFLEFPLHSGSRPASPEPFSCVRLSGCRVRPSRGLKNGSWRPKSTIEASPRLIAIQWQLRFHALGIFVPNLGRGLPSHQSQRRDHMQLQRLVSGLQPDSDPPSWRERGTGGCPRAFNCGVTCRCRANCCTWSTSQREKRTKEPFLADLG